MYEECDQEARRLDRAITDARERISSLESQLAEAVRERDSLDARRVTAVEAFEAGHRLVMALENENALLRRDEAEARAKLERCAHALELAGGMLSEHANAYSEPSMRLRGVINAALAACRKEDK